jgi:LysR family pca operon transcriptional activator
MVNVPNLKTTKRQLARIRHRHLICFLETAKSRKVSAAAEALNISQPATSKTLHELEDILGTKLFDRGGKAGLTLTATGRLFLRYAGASVAALREGIDSVKQDSRYGEPKITVGVLPTVATSVMPYAIQEFKKTHDTPLRVITRPNNALLDQLRLGELDLVVGRLGRPQEMSGFSFTHLYSEQLVLVVRPGHPLADEAEVDVHELESMTALVPTKSGLMRPVIDRFWVAHGIQSLPDYIEARSPDFCRQYALSSDAVWLISHGVVAHDLETGTLRALHVDTSDTQGSVGFTIRADMEPSPTLRQLMDTVAEVAIARAPADQHVQQVA